MPDKIEEDQGLDATPEDSLAKLSSAKELNVALPGLAIAAAIAFGWGGVRLHSPAAVVLALLPGVLIYLVHREPLLYAIFKPKRDPRTDLGTAFIICGLGLILGTRDVHFVEVPTLLVYAALVALLCCAGVFSLAHQNSELLGASVAMLFVAGLYGWGLAATADAVLDKSTPESYATTVQDKHESHGRSTSYYLDLAPWGPIQGLNDVSVSRTTYEGAFIGELVCLELRRGVLHVEWYQVVACTRQSGH